MGELWERFCEKKLHLNTTSNANMYYYLLDSVVDL